MNHLFTLALLVVISTDSMVQARINDANTAYHTLDYMRSNTSQQLLSRNRRAASATPQSCFQDFFVERTVPTGFRASSTNLQYICQQLPSDTTKTYFASLFDTNYGIPIYSAYTVKAADAPNIGTSPRENFDWREESGISPQGTDALYNGQKTYAKGHLLPAAIYSFGDDYIESTFTYTNAVPQVTTFNSGEWAQYERHIKEYTKTICSKNSGDMYLITGISEVTYQGGTATQQDLKLLKSTIKIPRSMWTAGCCVKSSTGLALGNFAVIGNNFKDKSKIQMTSLSVKDLEKVILAGVDGFGGTAINLFPGKSDCSDPTLMINIKKRGACTKGATPCP